MRKLYFCFAITLLLLAACTPAAEPEKAAEPAADAAAATANPHVGTWTLNVAKSTYTPGPAPKSQTLKIEAWGDDGLTYVAEGVGGDDKPTKMEFQAKFDGKDYEVKGTTDADMLSYNKVDANTLDATLKLKGATVSTAHVVVSEDGKTRTVTQTGKNAAGNDINIVSVYEKQ